MARRGPPQCAFWFVLRFYHRKEHEARVPNESHDPSPRPPHPHPPRRLARLSQGSCPRGDRPHRCHAPDARTGSAPQRSRGACPEPAEGLFCLLTIPVRKELLDRMPRLRVVSNMAAGVDNVDVAECTRRGIPVGNTPGVLTNATADLTMALLLAAARRTKSGE